MKFLLAPLLLATVALAADMGMNIHGGSYNFGYNTGDAGGHSRSESGHGGTVSGSYSYVDPNGHLRKVTYTAGPEGYKPSGDIGVDQKTAAQAAALAALAPKAPVAHHGLDAVQHGGYYGGHHGGYYGGYHGGQHGGYYGPAHVPVAHNVYSGHNGYVAKW